ncbi:unnamed protein product, partial [Vitis vinifera]
MTDESCGSNHSIHSSTTTSHFTTATHHPPMATLSLLSPPKSHSLSSLHHRNALSLRTSSTLTPRTRPLLSIRAFSAPALTQDDLKKLAADKAVDYVKSGMVLGLGTGSTAAFVVAKLGHLLKTGQLSDIVGVPTSKRTEEQALSLGIPLSQCQLKLCSFAGNTIWLGCRSWVVEHGLFLDMATAVIIAGKDGVTVKTK